MKVDPSKLPEPQREQIAQRVRELLGVSFMRVLKTVENCYGEEFAAVCGADVFCSTLAACIVSADPQDTGLLQVMLDGVKTSTDRQRALVAAIVAAELAKAQAEAAIIKAAGGLQ